MKRCPECLRSYDDDSLKYCADDGFLLVMGEPAAETNRAVAAVAAPDNVPHQSPVHATQAQESAIDKAVEEKFTAFRNRNNKIAGTVSGIIAVVTIVGYFILKPEPRSAVRRSVVSYITTVKTASGVKLDIHAKPGERVGVSQDAFQVLQPIMTAGKPIDGEHRIELRNSGGYAPGPPTCEPASLILHIVHRKNVLTGWQFPAKARISYIVDGVEMKANTNSMLDAFAEAANKGPVLDHGEYVETLVTKPTCETLEKLANAQSAKIKINDATIDLSETDRTVFKEFASAIGLK